MNKVARARRFDRIGSIGCLGCRKRGWFNVPQTHHLNLDQHAGQIRIGDEATIGLCPWHHVGEPLAPLNETQCRKILGPSMKHEPIEFRAVFGTDMELLCWQNELIADAESVVIGRVA